MTLGCVRLTIEAEQDIAQSLFCCPQCVSLGTVSSKAICDVILFTSRLPLSKLNGVLLGAQAIQSVSSIHQLGAVLAVSPPVGYQCSNACFHHFVSPPCFFHTLISILVNYLDVGWPDHGAESLDLFEKIKLAMLWLD